MTETDQYDQRATDFLNRFGIELKIERAAHQIPPACWDGRDYGTRYSVTIARGGRIYTFPYWGSIIDKRNGDDATAADILECIGLDASRDLSPDDVYDEFGPMPPSRCIDIADHAEELVRVLHDDDCIDALQNGFDAD